MPRGDFFFSLNIVDILPKQLIEIYNIFSQVFNISFIILNIKCIHTNLKIKHTRALPLALPSPLCPRARGAKLS